MSSPELQHAVVLVLLTPFFNGQRPRPFRANVPLPDDFSIEVLVSNVSLRIPVLNVIFTRQRPWPSERSHHRLAGNVARPSDLNPAALFLTFGCARREILTSKGSVFRRLPAQFSLFFDTGSAAGGCNSF